MDYLKGIIEFIFSVALFVNALLFIPQIIKLFKEKSAKGVSLITFLGFLLIQFATVMHGVINKDYILIFGYIFSMIMCGAVVVLVLRYKLGKASVNNANDITLEEIIEQLPGHIYWKDKAFNLIGSNTNNWKDFGMESLADFKKKTDYDIFPKDQADKLRAIDEEVMLSGELRIAEEELLTRNGDKALYLSYKMPLKNKFNETLGIIGISIDITNARKVEMARLEMLENIIAVMPGNVYWMDKEGVYLGCNDNQAKLIGFSSRKEIIGKRNKDIPGFLIPEILDPVNKKVMETGLTITAEEPAILPDGTKATFLSNKVPLFNNEKQVIGMVGISIDITDRKKAEQELKEAKLTAERMQAMKTLAASIAHELHTPLRSISMAAEGIKEYFPKLAQTYEQALKAKLTVPRIDPAHYEALLSAPESIESETQEAFTVIEMLLTNLNRTSTEKLTAAESRTCSIKYCVEEALRRYPFDRNEKGLVNIESLHDFNFVGDDLLIIHVLFNLLKNALYQIKAADKGVITLWTVTDNGYNTLHFKDTAKGIAADVLPHIFNQFFSNTTFGTGIGLAFCKLVMDSLGGRIECIAEEGKYAEFVLYFPIDKVSI